MSASTPAPPVEGPGRACAFVRDAVLGRGSVDVLLVGDSNTGFDGNGWQCGIAVGLWCLAPERMYGTNVVPFTDTPAYGLGCHPTGGVLGRPSADTSGGFCNSALFGLRPPPEELSGELANPDGGFSVTDSPFDWAWFDGLHGAGFTSSLGTWTIHDAAKVSPMRTAGSSALVHRVVHGVSGGARPGSGFHMSWSGDGLSQRRFISSVDADAAPGDTGWRWTRSEHRLELGSAPSGPLSATVFGPEPGFGVRGQAALAFHSVYRPIAGWSVSTLEHRAGATMSTVAADLESVASRGATGPGPVAAILREHRDRQLAAGGTGRVLVFIQGGINVWDWWQGPPPAPDRSHVWSDAAQGMIDAVRREWQVIGAPPGDLAFAVMASHQAAPDDFPLSAIRPLCTRVAMVSGEVAVRVERLVPYAELVGPPAMHEPHGPAHLTRYGYEEIGRRIVSAMYARACPGDLDFDGRVNGSDVGMLLGEWGRLDARNANSPADMDSDGDVDGADLGALVGSLGDCP